MVGIFYRFFVVVSIVVGFLAVAALTAFFTRPGLEDSQLMQRIEGAWEQDSPVPMQGVRRIIEFSNQGWLWRLFRTGFLIDRIYESGQGTKEEWCVYRASEGDVIEARCPLWKLVKRYRVSLGGGSRELTLREEDRQLSFRSVPVESLPAVKESCRCTFLDFGCQSCIADR